MITDFDVLSIRLEADFKPFEDALARLDDRLGSAARTISGDFDAVFEQMGSRLSRTFEDVIRTGKISFQDLKATALQVLSDIASAIIRAGLDRIGGLGGCSFGGGLGGLLNRGLGALFGRASGGPVNAGLPFVVGEKGPELFVPRSPGGILPHGRAASAGGATITVNIFGPQNAEQIRQSGAQVGAAVSRALARSQRNL
jgi:phage-related minor tail protein